jgi:hypothetical protein
MWISIAFWGEFVLCMMAMGEDLLPFGVALILFALTITAGIGFCVVGYRKPPRTTAVVGLLISAVNVLLVFLLILASLTAAGLTQFR